MCHEPLVAIDAQHSGVVSTVQCPDSRQRIEIIISPQLCVTDRVSLGGFHDDSRLNLILAELPEHVTCVSDSHRSLRTYTAYFISETYTRVF